MELTGCCGCCADIICAISAANGLSAGAVVGAEELVLAVVVVVAAVGTADVVNPADVLLEPEVTGGIYGNAMPLLNT